MIDDTENTEPLAAGLQGAAWKMRRIDWTNHADWSTHNLRHTIDWEARLWDLTSKLAVQMADRCQEGLMTPKEFGELSWSMAAWTVSVSVEAMKPKPATDEEIKKLLKEMQK